MKNLQAVFRCDECGKEDATQGIHTTELPVGWVGLRGITRSPGEKHLCSYLCLTNYAAKLTGGRFFTWYEINTGEAKKAVSR